LAFTRTQELFNASSVYDRFGLLVLWRLGGNSRRSASFENESTRRRREMQEVVVVKDRGRVGRFRLAFAFTFSLTLALGRRR
jgi:hypothetical protein